MSDDLFSSSNAHFSRYGFTENDFAAPKRDTFALGDIRDDAVLFLYGPTTNKFKKTALYSRTYNFDDNTFRPNMERVIDSVVNSGGGDTASIGRGVNPYEQFTYTPRKDVTLEGSLLADNWTFTLVLAGKSNRISSSAIIATSAISGMARTVYTGILVGEPFIGFGGQKQLNPDCRLEILHKNQTAVDISSGRTGTTHTPRNRHSDWFFREATFNSLTSRNQGRGWDGADHHMAPSKLGGGIREEGGSFYTVPGVGTEIRRDQTIQSSDIVDDPKQHLSTITRGIVDYLKQNEHAKSIFGDSDFEPSHDEEVPDRVSSALSSSLHIPTSGLWSREDLDVTRDISLGELDRSYDLHVYPKTFEDSAMYGSDSETNNLINKLSYEIGTIVGVVMNRLAMSSINFVYSIERQADGSVREGFRCQHVGYIYKVEPHDGQRLRDLLEIELRQGVFRKIYEVLGGDYHLMVNASTTDVTTIRLNPLGMMEKNKVDYVIPNILGGMISATIGSTSDSAHNQARICDLLSTYVGGVEHHSPNPQATFNRRDVDNWDSTYDNRPSWMGAPPSGHNSENHKPPMETPDAPMPSTAEGSGLSKKTINTWDDF